MTLKLESLHLEVLAEAVSDRPGCSGVGGGGFPPRAHNRFALQDLASWTRDKSQVEIVDLVLKIRDKVVSSSPPSSPSQSGPGG